MSDRNKEDGCETQESSSVLSDKHVRARIGKHRLQAHQESIGGCRVSKLAEEPGEALNIRKFGRAYRHLFLSRV